MTHKDPTACTVLIIEENETKSVHINRHLLHYIKPTLIALSTGTVLLALAASVLVYKNHQTAQENSQLQQQVVDLKNANSAEVSAKLSELKKAEKAVLELQNYAQERGAYTAPVKKGEELGKPNDAAGGPVVQRTSVASPSLSRYAENTSQLLTSLKTLPLGVPINTEISSTFGGRANPFSGHGSERHDGLDFRGSIGEPVQSTASGVVSFAGSQGGYGNVVRIQLNSGYELIFAHLSAVEVRSGQQVQAGEVIGKLGSTGRSTGPHLHYEIRKDGVPVDPEQFLTIQ